MNDRFLRVIVLNKNIKNLLFVIRPIQGAVLYTWVRDILLFMEKRLEFPNALPYKCIPFIKDQIQVKSYHGCTKVPRPPTPPPSLGSATVYMLVVVVVQRLDRVFNLRGGGCFQF